MRNPTFMAISLVVLLSACHKRSEIKSDETAVLPSTQQSGTLEPSTPPVPVTNADWKDGSPASLVGNWASSLFQDQRCTAFYTFSAEATAELNVICLNVDKKQFEREFRRYTVAQYPGSQQIRFKPTESSCGPSDTRTIKAEGAAFLYALENQPAADQALKLALWEPDVNKTPLNLSKSDGLMVEGFPGKTGTYLGMPILSGCFSDGLVTNFQATVTP